MDLNIRLALLLLQVVSSLSHETLVHLDKSELLSFDGLGLNGDLALGDLSGGLDQVGAHEASPLGLVVHVVIEDPDVVLVVVAVVANGMLATIIGLRVDSFFLEGVNELGCGDGCEGGGNEYFHGFFFIITTVEQFKAFLSIFLLLFLNILMLFPGQYLIN